MGALYRKTTTKTASRLLYYLQRAVKVAPGLFNRVVRRGVFSFDSCAVFWRRARFVYADGDYVRNSSLEMAAREIKERGVSGEVAELGVFRGDYAKLINQAFPDRKLYLFDTFEGFDSRDERTDKERDLDSLTDDFSDTSVDLVLRKMKHPDNCIICKGYFPDSAQAVEENAQFAFVSIDTDLYQPIYAGLVYFWNRLIEGGYIFIHDYQNIAYTGSKAAVRDFCDQYGVSYFLMSDNCGSAVISKPWQVQSPEAVAEQ